MTVSLHSLSDLQVETLCAMGKHPATSSELGVPGHVMFSLANRGLLSADKNGSPIIYRITAKGEEAAKRAKAPVRLVEAIGPIAKIQRAVAEHFRIAPIEMVSDRRAREVARPRQVAMYFAKMLTTKSLPDIGRRFGNRDHTTVIHAIRQVEKLIQTDREFRHHIETLEETLGSLNGDYARCAEMLAA